MDPQRGEPTAGWGHAISRAGLGQAVRPPHGSEPFCHARGNASKTANLTASDSPSGPNALKRAVEEDCSEIPRDQETVGVTIMEVDDASSWSGNEGGGEIVTFA